MLFVLAMRVELPENDLAVDVGGQPLLSPLVLECLLSVGGRQLEDAARGPGGQQAEEVAQVGPRLDAVHLAAGEQADEHDVVACAIVAAHEQPVLATDCLPTPNSRRRRPT